MAILSGGHCRRNVVARYTMLHTKEQTVGMGVKTGAASFAFWQVDPSGISLWLGIRNGGNGVQLAWNSRTVPIWFHW